MFRNDDKAEATHEDTSTFSTDRVNQLLFAEFQSRPPLKEEPSIVEVLPTVNIAGLPKQRLLIALFNNVFKKSNDSKRRYFRIADESFLNSKGMSAYIKKTPIGTDRAPLHDEVTCLVYAKPNETKMVDAIGAVQFKMDFSGDTIDTSAYDAIHETNCTQGVKTAKQCIDELRLAFETEQELKQKEEAEKAKERAAKQIVQTNRDEISNSITAILAKTFSRNIRDLAFRHDDRYFLHSDKKFIDCCTLGFYHPSPTIAVLKMRAETLQTTFNLDVLVIKGALPHIRFNDSLEVIAQKTSALAPKDDEKTEAQRLTRTQKTSILLGENEVQTETRRLRK